MITGDGGPEPAAPVAEFVPTGRADVEIGKWIGEGWNLVSGDLVILAVVTLVFLVVNSVIPIILQGPLAVGMHLVFVNKIRKGQVDFGDLFKGFEFFVPALLVMLVQSIFVSIGMLACIIPGLVLAAMYQFSYMFVLDRKMEFWPAMQASHAIVKQNYLGFTFFLIALGLLQIVGLLLCVVGLFVTIPVMYAAVTVAYRDLVGFSNEPAL
jgi:uncharacterized membrane protein